MAIRAEPLRQVLAMNGIGQARYRGGEGKTGPEQQNPAKSQDGAEIHESLA
jgi:hypothetical protein